MTVSGGRDDDAEERPSRYRVEETEQAEADREGVFLRLLPFVGPEHAARWYTDLRRAIAELRDFPGPLSHAIDEAASARYGYEIRRMLYHGPRGRRSRTPYRVLFTILPAARGEDEAVIRVLRVLHGAQEIGGPGQETQDEKA